MRDIVTADAISRGKNAEYKRPLKTESITSTSMEIRIRREGRNGRRLGQTEASKNRCGRRLIKSSITRTTVRRRSTKALRACPSVSYKRAKTVVETPKWEHENATSSFAGLSERTKTVGRERNKLSTERRGGKGVSPATCPTVWELGSRLAWKQESTGKFLKRRPTTPRKYQIGKNAKTLMP